MDGGDDACYGGAIRVRHRGAFLGLLASFLVSSQSFKISSLSFCIPTATNSLWQKQAIYKSPNLLNTELVWHLFKGQ